jgi:MFS family permease
VAAALFAIGAVLIANKTQKNSLTAIGSTIVTLLGCIILAAVPGVPKLVGFYLAWSMTGTNALIQTLISNNVSGYTKRVFYNASGMVAMTVGNFIGPLLMRKEQAPSYIGAMIAFSISNAVIIVCIIIAYILMKKENNRRLANPSTTKHNIYLDLTDKQDRNIIYKL